MIFEVRSGGTTRRVELNRRGSGWTVNVDGRELSASFVGTGGRWSLLVGDTDRARLSWDVAFLPGPGGDLLVHVDGRQVPVTVSDPRRALRHGRSVIPSGGEYDGPGRVTTPMPGRIVKLLVKPGDTVQARQGVVVVEAMKMENELRAPKAGTVAAVHVQEGATVEAGATLVTID